MLILFRFVNDAVRYVADCLVAILLVVWVCGGVAAPTVSTAVFTSSRPSVTGHADISKLVFSNVVLLVNMLTFVSAFRVRSHSSALDVKLVILNAKLFLVKVFHLF